MDTTAEKQYWEHVRRQGTMLMVAGTAATVLLISSSMWHPIIATVMTYFSALGTVMVAIGHEFRGDLSRTAFGTAIAAISSFVASFLITSLSANSTMSDFALNLLPAVGAALLTLSVMILTDKRNSSRTEKQDISTAHLEA